MIDEQINTYVTRIAGNRHIFWYNNAVKAVKQYKQKNSCFSIVSQISGFKYHRKLLKEFGKGQNKKQFASINEFKKMYRGK